MSEELAEYEVEPQEEKFIVDSDERAAYAMRKLKAIVDRQLSNQRVADKEIERCEAWLRSVNGSLEYSANIYRQLLMDYIRREREAGRKSIPLPHGTLKSNARPATVEVDDEFVDWAQVNARHLLKFPDAPPPKPVLKAVKEALEKGEQIEHAKIVEGGVGFTIEVK